MEALNAIIWPMSFAAIMLVIVVMLAANYINKSVSVSFQEEWSETGLARQIRKIHLLVIGSLGMAAFAGLIAGGFLWSSAAGWTGEPDRLATNSVEPPEWLCRD